MAEENKDPQEEENKEESPFREGEFDERTSYSFLFFLLSGALLFVTVWAFWDDEFIRRGYKDFQDIYNETQYERTRAEYLEVSEKIKGRTQELREAIAKEEEKLEENEEYQRLADAAWEAQVALDEAKEKLKFEKSRLDEYYYYYKKAQHEGNNYEVELSRVEESKQKIKEFEPVIEDLTQKRDKAEAKLLEFKARIENLRSELAKLTSEKIILAQRMDFYKPFNLFLRPTEIKQTVITGARRNKFKEMTYKVDRCHTCHVSYDDPYYKDFENPLKTHPNREILIDNHNPQETGCTWCHRGQGPATAPTEDAHGSHHENDQTLGLNEPILIGSLMQANCTNCHSEVVELEGAPILTKGKKLFLKLGCHGCHLVEGYADEPNVGPRLNRIAAKVDPSWLFRWVKEPKQYLPRTRMPNFDLSDEHALAISAYIMDASEDGYELPETFKSGNPEKGKELFESVGCQACHKLKGKGELFAPDLSRIAEKVSADWLVSWLSNPKDYNHESIMPNMRLSLEQASDITAYLMQFGEPKKIPGIERRLKDPDAIQFGKTLVRRRGCFACHAIPGMENEGRIAPELSSFGSKQTRELEFGDTHIPHTWESWTRTKLKDPQAYRTERILDKMPNFDLAPDEIEALMVFLRGLNGVYIPDRYQKHYSKEALTIERGRRLIRKFNCRGCHVVEGYGGDVQAYLGQTAQYPPPLEMDKYHVGERIKGSWLFSFLKNPTPVRKWMEVKMPTFALSNSEVRDLTAYFELMAPTEIRYEAGLTVKKHMESIETGVKIVNYMECDKCHDAGDKGIEFKIAQQRLRSDWVPKWLKDTREMIPWTPMPNHWPKEDGEYTIQGKFHKLNDVAEGDIDKQVQHVTDLIMSYDNPDIDFSLSLDTGDPFMDEGFFGGGFGEPMDAEPMEEGADAGGGEDSEFADDAFAGEFAE